MKKWAYYNDIDPFCCEWVRNLIKKGLIMEGEVDERSIKDVAPEELMGYRQCHFFGGIGGWSRALRLAGWPEDRPVWTGSCPCQGFSAAGRGKGFADERHLWPYWFHLIRVCRPPVIFGEQVASKLALSWLDLVFDDLEGEGYSCGAVDLPACGVGAAHIRQRLWFVAESRYRGEEGWGLCRPGESIKESFGRPSNKPVGSGDHGLLANTISPGVGGGDQRGSGTKGWEVGEQEDREGVADELGDGCEDAGTLADFWHSCEWLPCRDGKWRATEPGILPLAHGVPARVGRLRAYGNAIGPQVAAEFIKIFIQFTGQQEPHILVVPDWSGKRK